MWDARLEPSSTHRYLNLLQISLVLLVAVGKRQLYGEIFPEGGEFELEVFEIFVIAFVRGFELHIVILI